jgi:segregation and condensation protein B
MQNGSGPGPGNSSDAPAPDGGEAAPAPAGQAAPGPAGGQAAPDPAGEQVAPGPAGGQAAPGYADEAGPAGGHDGPGLQASLEAIMLVADEPVSEVVIAQVLERPRAEVAGALRELAASYAAERRGFDLREVAGGWRFYTREECAPVVERFVSDGQEVRLTQAALETLAVVAYRQPVSRARVSAVRGVNCDGVIRTLVLRGLVEEAGTDPETGAILFATTAYFLERLGLPSLDALPELAPFLPDHLDDEPDAGHEPAAS